MGKLNCMVTMTTSFPSSLRGIILASKKPLAKILPALAEDAGGSFWPCPCIQARIQRQDQNRNKLRLLPPTLHFPLPQLIHEKQLLFFKKKEDVQMRMEEFKITLGS